MNGEVFVDSGAFIAFLDRADRRHAEAAALFAEPPRRWVTSIPVVSESYTWLLHRFGEDTARSFRLLIDGLPGLHLLGADSRHHAAVGAKLERLRGTKLTYVDASCLVWLAERRIVTVWGTDHHLAIEGAGVVPGPPV